ncbi:50S ribosomal protein L35 [Candidatus Saccharibacteria bacterium]|nr:50S ribosomal protein L35 [Candidatus Saccharibacteria bacterium]MCL1963088.1 50S ribosomal protein L35 [Candidatus Saccharibacteria bacterium]
MPKLKTHKGTAKRVRTTKSGKLLRQNAATHHKLSTQTANGKRAKAEDTQIKGKIAKDIRDALGI